MEQNSVANIILNTISEHFGVSIEEMKSDSLDRRITKARHFVFYFMRCYTKLYLQTIGDLLSKDHSNVCFGYKTVNNQASIYPEYLSEVNTIKKKIELRLKRSLHTIVRQLDVKGRTRRFKEQDEVFQQNDFFTN